jgi:2-methylisocitrate lyase-like PEP mutase family enzyme
MAHAQASLRSMILHDDEPVYAPLVLNPLMAKLAQQAGFRALYLGGGSMGYLKACTEANLSLTEMVQAGVEVRAASPLPLILDGACGWGDPMHMHHTITMAEAAGFAAIEVEDQLLPKRAHHHIGIEHVVPLELMVAKVKECLAARRSREFLIIARTNAARSVGVDEALRRGEAMHKAGADMLLVLPGKPDDIRVIAERLPAPLMFMMSGARLTSSGLTMREWGDLGYRLFVDASTPFMAMHHALRQSYAAMAKGDSDPLIGTDTRNEQKIVHETIGLDAMLAIEKQTVER